MQTGLRITIADDIRRVAQRLGQSTLSRSEYVSNGGRYSLYQVYEGGESWESWCGKAGVHTRKKETVPDEVYFERLKVALRELGRPPKASERKRYGLNFSKRRYPTLAAFLHRAESIGVLARPPAGASTSPPDEEETVMGSQAVDSVRPNNESSGAEGHAAVPPIPAKTRRRNWQRTNIAGFPYAPHDELRVVALFAILCAAGRLPWEILELSGGKGIDATCWDRRVRKEVRVELKYILTKSSWNHDTKEVDHVVCWENRWADFPKSVTELRKVING